MIKTILVPVVGHSTDAPVYGTALVAGRLLGAHLEFLFVGPEPSEFLGLSKRGDFAPGPALPESLFDVEKAEEARLTDAHRFFKNFCERERIAIQNTPPGPHAISAEWRHEQGDQISHVVRRTRFNDLLVTRPTQDGMGSAAEIMEAALTQGGRPILLAPLRAPDILSQTVVIAWKETPEAARAVTAAMPFLDQTDKVVVLSVNEGDQPNVESAKDIAQQFRWHRFDVEARCLAPVGGSAAQTLIDAARELKASLLVMGAYGHSRVREIIFGGFTRHVLRGVELPVLLIH
jgi:nucleotide-binding universal stress UspA family protein